MRLRRRIRYARAYTVWTWRRFWWRPTPPPAPPMDRDGAIGLICWAIVILIVIVAAS
jgi:hypothetical protein